MTGIIEICENLLKEGKNTRYRAKRFTTDGVAALIQAAKAAVEASDHATAPGRIDCSVSEKNHGETAFQRALYHHRSVILEKLQGEDREVTWCDLELPITFREGVSRRRCIDLIGRAAGPCTFLCELKYTRAQNSPSANQVDYAVFEALIYMAIIKSGATKLRPVRRENAAQPFDWQEVAVSNRILILANSGYFQKAREDAPRIGALLERIKKECGIDVLLYHTDKREISHEPCGGKIWPVFKDKGELRCKPVFG